MRIQEFRFALLRIPFKVAFRHSSAERAETSSVWVEALSSGGLVGYGDSCPRPYVTGETTDTARDFFARHESALRASVTDLETLRSWSAAHYAELDASPAAWCALELAVLDLLAKDASVSVETLLSLPPLSGRFQYTAVLGDAKPAAFDAMAAEYAARGFHDFKVKLSGDISRDAAKLASLNRLEPPPARIRADANNLWSSGDEAIAFLRQLDCRFFALEEPIGANQYAELAKVGEALGCRIVLDESFARADQIDELRSSPDRWLINVRVSKMGGLLRSLAVLDAAIAAGLGIIVGAQVGETSLLTRAALTVARAAGTALVAQEGAFGTLLLEHDVCDAPLMFGKAGVLDVARYRGIVSGPGFGVEVTASPKQEAFRRL